MKKLTAWFTLGTFGFFGALTVVSCGSDEATGPGSGGGGIIGSGGSGGMDGGIIRDSGLDSTAPDNKLGQACATDSECGMDGLICIKRDDTVLGGQAPPKGLCTTPCSVDDTCLEFAADALCVEVDIRGDKYCFEGCAPGDSLADKCHARNEFACQPVLLGATNDPCQVHDDCALNQICDGGTCSTFVSACLPACGGDHDCASGFFCDFFSGMCAPEQPTGLALNSACDTDAVMNECNGLCLPLTDTTSDGFCSALCNFSAPFVCGWDGQGAADAACLWTSIFAREPGNNDIAYCGQLCDCNSDCLGAGELCAPFDQPMLEEFWGRLGFCSTTDASFTAADSLDCPGTGGAGGAPSNGGAPGVGGASGAGGV